MAGVVAGLLIFAIVYVAGIVLAFGRDTVPVLVQTFKDVVEAIQDIKKYKANQGTKGS